MVSYYGFNYGIGSRSAMGGYGNGYCLKILAKWMNSITRE